MVPRFLRWLAPLLLLTGVFVGPFANGGTDALFVPFLVVAVWRWDRFPGRSHGLAARMGGAGQPRHRLFDQADAVVLRPVPDGGRGLRGPPVAGRDRWRPALRYVAIAAGAFVVVNLPFIVCGPRRRGCGASSCR